jgi:hypothetical protein
MDGGDLFASHETAVFDPAKRRFTALWRPTEGSEASRIGLTEFQSVVESVTLPVAGADERPYGKCRLKMTLARPHVHSIPTSR